MSQALTVIEAVREELAPLRPQISAMLPSHISVEKFESVSLTAVQNNPGLLDADRQSLFVACMNAANDGLLPDKREGAFVVYNEKVKVKNERGLEVDRWVKTVKWMPMIGGILKKAYQSGKVQSITCELVHEKDVYRRAAGDNAEIIHEPLDFGDRGKVVGGYAIIRLKDADPYREVMSLDQINRVRNVSKSKDSGPWGPWWDEMAKKTILRRAMKRVPISAELDVVLQRDDYLYDLDAEHRPLVEAPTTKALAKAALFSDEDIADADHGREVSARQGRDGGRTDSVAADQDAGQSGGRDEGDGDAERAEDDRVADVENPAEHAPVGEADTAQSDSAGRGEGGQGDDAAAGGVDAEVFQSLLNIIAKAETDAELDEAWELVETGPHYELLSPAQETAILNAADRRRIVVMKFRAYLSSREPPREYDDPTLWADEILAKLKTLEGQQAQAFWRKNFDYVRSGARKSPAEAQRIWDIIEMRNLDQ